MKRFDKFITLVLLILLFCTQLIAAGDKQFHAKAVNYPPFTLEDTMEHGMSWELCKAALETQGYEVSVEFAPWARAYSDTKDGEYDGLLISYWTEERSELFAYPDYPVAFVSTGFFKKKGRSDIIYSGNLRELSSYDIGVERLASMGDEFDHADFLKKTFVKASLQLLKMVYLENIDIGVAGFEYSRANLEEIDKLPGFEGIKNDIEFMQPPLDKRPAYLMISKKVPNYKQKLDDLNTGLKKIQANGVFEKILNKYDIQIADYFPEE